jgi:saccharopine dehydrogenase (NAD+, L-lysine forming)
MKIGLIKEGKIPQDKRVAFSPMQLKNLSDQYAGELEFFVESSLHRCFADDEYLDVGIPVVDDLHDCDVLMGIKEVPVHQLIADKTYVYFSHTIKKQPSNRLMLKEVLQKNIRLIDYELLKDNQGLRTVAFGKWAGVVGAYNGFLTYGLKSGLYELKRAYNCFDRRELDEELKKVSLPPIKIVVTGTGRVGKGVKEVLQTIGIREVDTHDFLHNYYEEPVYTILKSSDYYRRKTDGGYEQKEFYTHPERYESHFLKYAEVSDLLIAAAYWDPKAPKMFPLAAIQSEDFNISVIADITCDLNGSLPTTLKSSTVLEPVFDVDRDSHEMLPAFGKQNSISVMAIDNLPTELPRDASEEFGSQLAIHLIPELLKVDSQVLDKATIAKNGDLTLEYMYLQDYVNDSETTEDYEKHQ